MTFQLPLILYSIVGRGAHLVTVNDYLSKRDGEYCGHIATELGLSVGIVTSQGNYKFIHDDEIKIYKGEEKSSLRNDLKLDVSQMDGLNLIESAKKESYNCDITYGTNNEFGFDYLRDNMAWDTENLSQRELYFCIIDEADSILIDEARTPLIISGIPSESDTEKYSRFASAVSDLIENEDYVIDYKTRSSTLTEKGIEKVEAKLGVENIWNDYSMAYHIENAIKAKSMFHKDDHYLVKNGEVLIVDEFTGRVLPGRRYSEGLHQAIEAKEGVEIKQESKTFATITFQNFFRLYKILCGGSGTIMTEAEEFYKIYGLESVPVPTNRPVIRIDYPDSIYKNESSKFRAVIKDIVERHKKGQPVLVGTTSVEKSEIVSNLLDIEKIPHEVLNAKYHEQEAKIIAKAGSLGAVTVATNMAGRGADIVIGGGRRGDKEWEKVKSLGGLHVIGTERHEARRIDNQLRGRTGRQGEPGSSKFYVSLDDQLMKILGGDIMQRLLSLVGMNEDVPIELKMISRQIETAQKRIESMNFDSRKRVVDYDDVMNQHREIFYSRRKNYLVLTDKALGKILKDGKVIDTNLFENKDLQKDFEVEKSEARKILQDKITELLKQELYRLSQNTLLSSKKISEKDIEIFLNSVSSFVPEKIFLSALNVSSSKNVLEELQKNLINKSEEEKEAFIEALANKFFEIKLNEFGNDFAYISKVLILQTMDNLWVEHLELMKDIREGIGLHAYAQKDPLVEYKNEAFGAFSSLISKINAEVAKKILRIEKVKSQKPMVSNLKTNTSEIDDISTGDREFLASEIAESAIKKAIKEKEIKEASISTNQSSDSKTLAKSKFSGIGRNDPCPCGSGKKFKKCHGIG